jgi:hypothetical protein
LIYNPPIEMNNQKKAFKVKDPGVGIILLIALTGLIIRLAAPLQALFPLNDGGLFYTMILDLQEMQYRLPAYINYNATEIPFAYPPLALYLTGLLADLMRVSTIDLVRILPAVISGLTILGFYLLAKEITSSKLQILFSVFAFAMLPRDFAWLIMGGGVTRSFGLLFALLTMIFAYRFYSEHRTLPFLSFILLGSLTVLTHPEATVHTALTALIFYLWKDRSLKGFLFSLGIASCILVATSPWWGLIISRHGLDPFLAVVNASRQDSNNLLVSILLFFRFLFTEEPFLPVLSVLGLIGLFASLAHKRTLLSAWLLILYLAEPRGAPLYMMVPLALLIGYALENVILPALHPERDYPSPVSFSEALKNIWGNKATRTFLIFLFFYSAISAYSTSYNIKNELSLQPTDIEALAWVQKNTPEDAKFILVTGQHPLRDAWSEWFPVLTGRKSQATLFGFEWVNDGKFGDRIDDYNSLQACTMQNARCLDQWSKPIFEPFTYIYIRHKSEANQFSLSISIQQNSTYDLVFQNAQTKIYRRANNE